MLKNPKYVYSPCDALVPARVNFGEYILDKLREHQDKTCLINGATDETLTYKEILQGAMNVAVSLHGMGVRKGHTIAICSENRNEFWSTVFGIACTGATITTVNVIYTKGEIKHVMSISKPRYIFISPIALMMHEKTLHSLDFLKKIIVFGDDSLPNTMLYSDLALPGRNNYLKSDVSYEQFQVADVDGQSDILFILYSSGTTGLPKGVMLTHLNVISTCYMPQQIDTENMLSIAPWFHAMGLMGGIIGLTMGRTGIYLAKFDMDIYLETIEKYKITQLTVVPPILVALCKLEDKRDFSFIKYIYSGAAPLHKDTLEAAKLKFPNATLMQGYGLTEVTLAVTRDTHERADEAKLGGVGYIVSGVTIKIVDPETREVLGPNQPGELCVKGPIVMKGYLGKDMKDDFDTEGFFKTGDIAYYDDDKYFFIVDRLKELIKYKGYQVPPAEIEAVLLQHEGIRDAAVVGKDHKSAGEVPVAFVVLQPSAKVTEKEIKDFVAERLSNPKHLRGGVRFVEEIPKNLSGKILRKSLRAMLKSGKSKL